MTTADLSLATSSKPPLAIAIQRAVGRGMMGSGWSSITLGIWIELFDGALVRAGHWGRHVIDYQWIAFAGGAALVILGAVVARAATARRTRLQEGATA